MEETPSASGEQATPTQPVPPIVEYDSPPTRRFNKKPVIYATIIASAFFLGLTLGSAASIHFPKKTAQVENSTESSSPPNLPTAQLTKRTSDWPYIQIVGLSAAIAVPADLEPKFEFEGLDSDAKPIKSQSYTIQNLPDGTDIFQLANIVKDNLGNLGWTIEEIQENPDNEVVPTNEVWFRFRVKKGQRESILVISESVVIIRSVDEQDRFSYPPELPQDLQSNIKPRWSLIGRDKEGKRRIVLEYEEGLPDSLQKEKLQGAGWVYAADGGSATKDEWELTIKECSPDTEASCINKVSIWLSLR
jgi:hypothetical protein